MAIWDIRAGRLTLLSCPFFRLLNVFRDTDMLSGGQRPRLSSLRVLALKSQEGVIQFTLRSAGSMSSFVTFQAG